MERGEKSMEDYANFKFPEEEKGKNPEVVELDQEITLEALEIKPEDIEGIEKQMEIEKNKEGISGKQSLAFEGSALARIRKEAPEAGIEKVELSEEDIKNCKERMEKDIEKAIADKTKSVQEKWAKEKQEMGRNLNDEDSLEEKEQLAERIREEIKSEQVWIREFQTSYLKDILDKKQMKDNGLAIEGEEWEGNWKDMVSDLKTLIGKKEWRKVIPRMGHMNNLDPEKFGDVSRSLFDTSDKEAMLEQINKMRGDEAAGLKTDAWKLGSELRYVAECFPELRSRIKLDDKNWEKMNDLLEDARKKGDYWKVSYQECNMKIIENMAKRGEIKAIKGKIERKDSVAE